jgi:hypothetical protein
MGIQRRHLSMPDFSPCRRLHQCRNNIALQPLPILSKNRVSGKNTHNLTPLRKQKANLILIQVDLTTSYFFHSSISRKSLNLDYGNTCKLFLPFHFFTSTFFVSNPTHPFPVANVTRCSNRKFALRILQNPKGDHS